MQITINKAETVKEKPDENMDHLKERLEALEKIVNNLDNSNNEK